MQRLMLIDAGRKTQQQEAAANSRIASTEGYPFHSIVKYYTLQAPEYPIITHATHPSL